jgi:hypothetical protein
VATGRAAFAQAENAKREVLVVVNGEDAGGRDAVEGGDGADRLATEVHERLGFDEPEVAGAGHLGAPFFFQ